MQAKKLKRGTENPSSSSQWQLQKDSLESEANTNEIIGNRERIRNRRPLAAKSRHPSKEDLETIRCALIDLYLSVKIRKNEEVSTLWP